MNPSAGIEGLKEHTREKSILTLEEVRNLFDEKKVPALWAGDLRHFVIKLLTASTGMRMGEVQALQVQRVSDNHLIVCHSLQLKYGLKDPKWGSARDIPIPTKTARYLHEVIELSPNKEAEDLVFWGVNRRTPIQHRDIDTRLYSAMEEVGITPEERRTRNITFHSWRHFANSMMRVRGIADAKVQRVTGHYSHFAVEDFKDVLAVQESVFVAGA